MTTPLHFNRYRAKSSSSKSVPSSPGAVKVPGAPGAATFTPTDAKKLFSKSFTPTSVMDTPWTPILSSLGLDVDCDSSAVSGGKSTNVLTPGPTFLNPFSVCDDFYGCLAGSESETVAGRGANAARHINPFSKSPPKCMLDIRFLSLLKAVESEDDEKVKSLIATGMSLDFKTTFKFETVLMRASQKGSISIVQELIGANAALDEQDRFGSTALIKAATQEHYEIVNLLLQAGASTDVTLKTGVFAEIDKKNNDKSTSLLRAAQRQQFNTAACLLKLGANIDTRDKQRYSPLMYAASAGHKSFVENSIAVGASLAFADREGNTALMLAIQKAEDEGITVLSAAASTTSRMSWEEAVAEAETSSLCSSWSTGFDKVLQQIHPGMSLSAEGGVAVRSYVSEVAEALIRTCIDKHSSLCEGEIVLTEDDKDILSVVLDSKEILKHAIAEGTKFYRKYKDDSDKTGGLQFSISECRALVPALSGGVEMSERSSVFFTAVLEYIAAEVLELAGNACKVRSTDAQMKATDEGEGISAADMEKAVVEDEELSVIRTKCATINVKSVSESAAPASESEPESVVPESEPGPEVVEPKSNERTMAIECIIQASVAMSVASLDAKNSKGCTALIIAAQKNLIPVADRLIKAGANIDEVDAEGNTALVVAVRNGNVGFVDCMLKAGASVNVWERNEHNTALWWATSSGQSKIIELVLKANPNLDGKDKDGNTALMVAAKKHNLAALEILLKAGASIDEKNCDECNALWLSVEHGKKDSSDCLGCVEFLANNGAKLDEKDKTGRSAILVAVEKGLWDIAELLANCSASGTAVNTEGRTALMCLAMNKSAKASTIELLAKDASTLDMQDRDGFTALMHAADMGIKANVDSLVASGAPLATVCNKSQTAVLKAVIKQSQACVDSLIVPDGKSNLNVSLNLVDSDGWSPVLYAAYNRQKSMVDALLKAGAVPSPTCADLNKGNVLISAAQNGEQAIVDCLIKGGAQLNITDSDGWTPITRATHKQHKEVVKLLADAGCDLDVQNKSYDNALLWAVYHDSKDLLKILIDNGVNLDAKKAKKGQCGTTALHLAVSKGHQNMIEMLCDAGAAHDLKDKSGFTPLLNAAKAGSLASCKILIQAGASIYEKEDNITGKNALEHAKASSSNKDLVDYLSAKTDNQLLP